MQGGSCFTSGGETQVAQKGGGCPIPGKIQGSEKPVVVEDVPAPSRRLGLDGLQISLSTQAILLCFATEKLN